MTGELRKELGKRIRLIRETLRLSQQDLSRLSGLNRAYIGGVERGERNITVDNIEKIAAGLGVSVALLFSRDSALSQD